MIWEFLTEPLIGGETGISALNLIIFVLIILIFFLVSKLIVSRLIRFFMKGVGVEKENRMVIVKIFHYIIIFIGIIVGLNYLGIQLTAVLALAGIMGIILGFGLQPVISNLVSGFLLMGEGSAKVGDWVEFDNTYGQIVDTGIRSSIMKTPDNKHVVVPNNSFAQSPFINYSYKDKRFRITCEVGVAYGSDVDKVRTTLIEIAKDNENVLEEPEPIVLFTGFGNSSLDFELKCWINTPEIRKRVINQINLEIDRRFREEEITVPFPQRDIWFKSDLEGGE